MKRIGWIDGLKGYACVLVVLHHFSLAFFPAIFYGNPELSHTKNQIDSYLSQSPVSVVLNGNYMVVIFCMLSAILVSLKVLTISEKQDISMILLKRYPRLMLPIIPTLIIVYCMLHLELFTNFSLMDYTKSPWLGCYYIDKPTFSHLIDSVFYTTWFVGDYYYSNAFWMLTYLFFGTFLSIVLSLMAWKSNKRILFVYIFIAVLFAKYNTLHFAFVVGTIIAYLIHENMLDKVNNSILSAIIFIIGIFLGGYPTGIVEPTNIYKFINFTDKITMYQFWHIIGAAFLIIGIRNLNVIQRILESKLSNWLGKVSYSIYIVHIPIIFSFSGYLYKKINSLGYTYKTEVLMDVIISLALILIIASLYCRYVERFCNYITNKLVKIFMK